MLSFAIADERFQPIGRRRAKIIERRSGIEHLELSFDNRLQVAVPTRPMTFVDTTRLDISERPNQGFRIAVLRSTSSVQARGCLLSGNPAVAGLMLISRATTERARRLSGSVFDEITSQRVGWAEHMVTYAEAVFSVWIGQGCGFIPAIQLSWRPSQCASGTLEISRSSSAFKFTETYAPPICSRYPRLKP